MNEREDSNIYKAYFRRHPDEWVSKALKRHLWSKQREIIKSVFENRRTVVAAGFDVGKTFVAACTALAFLYLYPLSKVITTAPTYTQVARILWSEIRTIWTTALAPENMPGRLLQTELNIEPDWFMLGVSPKYGYNFQGYHAKNALVILDEAPGILPEIKEGAESLMASSGAHMLQIGNPIRKGDDFYRDYNSPNCNPIKISAFDSPNFTGEDCPDDIKSKLVSKAWVAERKLEWGEDHPMYQSKVLARFPEISAQQIISYELVMAAVNRDIEPEGEKELALDVARMGEHLTVFTTKQGMVITDIEHESKRRTFEIAAMVKIIFDKDPEYTVVKIDADGIGGAVIDDLIALKNDKLFSGKIIPIHSTGNPIDKKSAKLYQNRRTEMWFDSRDWLGEGKIPNHDRLLGDLTAPEYDYSNATGKMFIEPKKATEKRLKVSPDFGDSAVYNMQGSKRLITRMVAGSRSYSTTELLGKLGL